MFPSPSFLQKTGSEVKNNPILLDPKRWKLHVSYNQTSNVLYRLVNLEDLVAKKVYRINDLTEEDFQRIIASECHITYASYILREYNVLGTLSHTSLTLYQTAV
jgi:hypothetical protein